MVDLANVWFWTLDDVIHDERSSPNYDGRLRYLSTGDGSACGCIAAEFWYGNLDGDGGSKRCDFNRSGLGCYGPDGWDDAYVF